MAKRITLTLAPELLEEVVKAKPKALSLSTYCALLVEKGMTAPEMESLSVSSPSALRQKG